MTPTIGLLLLILAVSTVNAVGVILQAHTRRKVIRWMEKKSRDQRTMKH